MATIPDESSDIPTLYDDPAYDEYRRVLYSGYIGALMERAIEHAEIIGSAKKRAAPVEDDFESVPEESSASTLGLAAQLAFQDAQKEIEWKKGSGHGDDFQDISEIRGTGEEAATSFPANPPPSPDPHPNDDFVSKEEDFAPRDLSTDFTTF